MRWNEVRHDRLVQLVCALLGALASLIVIIEYLGRETSQAYPEPPAPIPTATATPAPEIVPPLPTPPPEPEPEASEIVYRTPSGEKYHRASCRYVKGGRGKELTISEAQEQGLTACKACKPPPLP